MTNQSIYQIFAFFILVIGRCEYHMHVSVLATGLENHGFYYIEMCPFMTKITHVCRFSSSSNLCFHATLKDDQIYCQVVYYCFFLILFIAIQFFRVICNEK
jgi:hypothetical protein